VEAGAAAARGVRIVPVGGVPLPVPAY